MTPVSVHEADITSDAPTAPARSRAETRRRLIEAGTELFASSGLHAVTSAQIARRAGVASGTFYLHFQDKKALFREIVFEALDRLRQRQDRAAAAAGRDAREEYRVRTAELLRFAEENRDLIRVLFGRDHSAADLGEDVIERVVPDIESRLRERVVAGGAPVTLHLGAAAQAVAAMTVRVVAWWVEDPARATREEIVDTLLRMHPGYGREDG
jgi:AcrR family transcriptional regulator